MDDIETVYNCLKTFHFKQWDEAKLNECKALVKSLSKEDLRMLLRSRWMDKSCALYPTLFELYYKDELADVVNKLQNAETESLLKELKSTHSSFKKDKIREILLERYDEMSEEERRKAFDKLLD